MNPQQQGQPYPPQQNYAQAENYGTRQAYPQQHRQQSYQQQAYPQQYPQQPAGMNQQQYQNGYPQQYQQQPVPQNPNAKSRMVAALLAFFLTWVGAANFYLGYKQKAIGQLVLGCLTGVLYIPGAFFAPLLIIPVLAMFGIGIWAIVDFIYILTKKPPMDRDADGIPLAD